MPGKGVDEHGAAAGVDRPHPAQVAVVPAGLEQGGQRELIQGGRAAVADLLLRATASASAGGASTQPSRTAGASALLVVPMVKTRSGASPCSTPTGSLS